MRSILTAAALGSILFLPTIASAAFGDVAETNKNRNAIEYLFHTKVVQGYEDQTYKPEQAVNRAEFLKILMESEGLTIGEEFKECFSDVTTEWYAKYVCYAQDKGWVEGYTDGSFKPWQTVNKVEALKMLLEVQGFQEELKTVDTMYLFSDTKAGEWFAPYVSLAKKMNLLEETGDLYEPAQDMRRGTIAEVVFRSAIRKKMKHDAFMHEDVKVVFENEGLTYMDPSLSIDTPDTGTGSTIMAEQDTENTSTEEDRTDTPTATTKEPYAGTPPINHIDLKDGITIEFKTLFGVGRVETYAVLSNDPTNKLTWDTLKEALRTLKPDYEALVQIVELLEYQTRIGNQGRYSSIELLGGTMDDTGSMIVDIEAKDSCYGSITSQYFYKANVGMVEIKTINTTEAGNVCN